MEGFLRELRMMQKNQNLFDTTTSQQERSPVNNPRIQPPVSSGGGNGGQLGPMNCSSSLNPSFFSSPAPMSALLQNLNGGEGCGSLPGGMMIRGMNGGEFGFNFRQSAAATVADGCSGLIGAKKDQSMMECVPVPSSEHVAEIVGHNGCRIIALRAKTNTYIKTPVRGEEPVFVVTGRKEEVGMAKREILSAAEKISQIRAFRKGGSCRTTGGPTCAPTPVPGQVTMQVRVPYGSVGVVVGPKGATIKRIQQRTQTCIVTPTRHTDAVFEVTGLPDNVQVARREIEAHVIESQMSCGEYLTSSQPEILASFNNNLPHALEGFGFGLGLGIGLGAINSRSRSLFSVTGLGTVGGGSVGCGTTVGSSSGGGRSLPSLSSLHGFSNPNNLNGQDVIITNVPSILYPH